MKFDKKLKEIDKKHEFEITDLAEDFNCKFDKTKKTYEKTN